MRVWARLVNWGFYLLYHPLAFTYDAVSWAVSLGAWRSWQRAALAFLPAGGRVLELAHGTGSLQVDLQRAGWCAVGIDFSPQMGRLARRKLARYAVAGYLLRAQAQHLPFASAQFDAVVSTFPTRFILEPQTIAEVRRVLRPDGVLVVVFNGVLHRPRGLVDAIEWLYRITGQREEIELLAPFAAAGFAARREIVVLGNSTAHLLVATKTP